MRLCLTSLLALLLLHLEQQRTIDVREDTTKGNGRADESVEFLIASNGKLQVTRCDTLDFEILGRVPSQFKDFGSEIFEDGSEVDGGFGADSRLLAGDVAKVALYAAAWELKTDGLVLCVVLCVVVRFESVDASWMARGVCLQLTLLW